MSLQGFPCHLQPIGVRAQPFASCAHLAQELCSDQKGMAEAFSELAMRLKTAGRAHASSARSTVQNSLIVGVYARCVMYIELVELDDISIYRNIQRGGEI